MLILTVLISSQSQGLLHPETIYKLFH